MKKRILVMFCILLFFVTATYVFGAAANETTINPRGKHIKLTLISQTPDPAEPGEIVEVRWKVENTGDERADDIYAEFVSDFPFYLVPGTKALQYIGTLNPHQKDENAVIIKYKIKVDERAVEGDNEIIFRYRIGSTGPGGELKSFIDVQAREAILDVAKVFLEPQSIRPGSIGRLKILIRNTAYSVLRDIRVKLKFDDTSFAPIDSINEKTIEKLFANQTYELDFGIAVDPNAVSKIHRVPVEINYLDEIGRKYNKNSTLGIVVADEASYLLNIEEGSGVERRKLSTVTLSVSNIGSGELRFVTLTLPESNDYEIISSPKVYLGNLESDDFETAEFELYVKSSQKEIPLEVQIDYKDNYNQEQSNNQTLLLKVYSKTEAIKYGLTKPNNRIGILIVLVIVVAGFLGYRYWKKRKNKE